jgi:hypothetical protein
MKTFNLLIPCLSRWYSKEPLYPEERVTNRVQMDLRNGMVFITDIECPRIKIETFLNESKVELLIFNPN